MLRSIREQVRFALTGNTEGTQTLTFEKNGRRFEGRAEFDEYLEHCKKEQQIFFRTWRGDEPDYQAALAAMRYRHQKGE